MMWRVFISLYKLRNFFKKEDKAYVLGKRAAQGYNIYLTFGSTQTKPKDAHDSYRRYAMAMRHYKQDVCEEDSFLLGYNSES